MNDYVLLRVKNTHGKCSDPYYFVGTVFLASGNSCTCISTSSHIVTYSFGFDDMHILNLQATASSFVS